MGKFSAAKILDAADQKLQKAMNYLIDLLETGYVAEGRINGKNVRTEISPKVGFQILVDSVLTGGITDINGVLASITQIITNDPTNPVCWAEVGQYTVDGTLMNGFAIFNRGYSTTVPVCRIMTVDDGSFHIVDGNGKVRFYTSPNITSVKDANAYSRFYTDGDYNRMYDANNILRVSINKSGYSYIYDAAGFHRLMLDQATNFSTLRAVNGASYNEVGVDATGAYKITAGVKAYL